MTDIVVRIPAPLRAFSDGQPELRATAGTVGQVLRELGGRHPQLLQRVVDPDGDVRPLVNVYVDRANIRGLQGLDTPVPAGAVVSILPAVAGG